MTKQATNTVLMVRPSLFRSNEQTIENNSFQSDNTQNNKEVTIQAQHEFDVLQQRLSEKGVKVIVIQDTIDTDTPDALFPNNWITFHENGDVAIYPMFAPNRRLERREAILDIVEENGFEIQNVIDYSEAENEGFFLEGTGSMVLDRINKIAYLSVSPRSDEDLFIEFCEDQEYSPVIFSSNFQNQSIYHTNVMMSIATDFAIVCSEVITDKKERQSVLKHLKESGKEIISITASQMQSFAANVLELKDKNSKPFLAMSTTAYNSFTEAQRNKIQSYLPILHSDVSTIEKNGGGSVRCMIAEVFWGIF